MAKTGLPTERGVSTFSALMREARVLDEDAGIRFAGDLRGEKCMVFVTRFGPRYTIMAYSTKGRTGIPDRRLETTEVETPAALSTALRKLVGSSVRAYVY